MLIGGGEDGLALRRSSDDGVVLRSTESTRLNDERPMARMSRQLSRALGSRVTTKFGLCSFTRGFVHFFRLLWDLNEPNRLEFCRDLNFAIDLCYGGVRRALSIRLFLKAHFAGIDSHVGRVIRGTFRSSSATSTHVYIFSQFLCISHLGNECSPAGTPLLIRDRAHARWTVPTVMC